MSEDKPPRPLANLVDEAREGRLRVRMEPQQFVNIDRDCEFFKNRIQDIQQVATEIAGQELWGLGEGNCGQGGKELISGQTMVERYREKARGSQNSVYEVMESHYRVVEGIQDLLRAVRDRFMQQDAEWAARYREVEATLPARPPAPERSFGPVQVCYVDKLEM
ncbi:hypothetical protein [Nocardia sp. CNY236]|uniref:hypothetical protein n=1 Tax=Nocardia sp. CNY236 TaxID=1169152 RepID=UPI0004027ECA|nr:hypothetical protein [Nocardia sp. CNY236]